MNTQPLMERLAASVFTLVTAVGCAESALEIPADPPSKMLLRPVSQQPSDGPLIAAFDAAGEPLLVDAKSGVLRDRVPSRQRRAALDVAFDADLSRLLVVSSDADEGSSELAAYEVDAQGLLGARHHLAYGEGTARVVAAPGGALLFDRAEADRWRLVRDDGEPTPSLLSPVPISLRSAERGGAMTFDALGFDRELGTWTRSRVVALRGRLMEKSSQPLDLPANTSAEMVGLGRGDAVLVSNERGLVTFRHASAARTSAVSVRLEEPTGHVEGACALADDTVVVLSANPPRLDRFVVASRIPGVPLQVARIASLPLASNPIFQDGIIRRSLVVADATRLFVATEAGVMAVDVGEASDAASSLALDPSFRGSELRGPIALVPTRGR